MLSGGVRRRADPCAVLYGFCTVGIVNVVEAANIRWERLALPARKKRPTSRKRTTKKAPVYYVQFFSGEWIVKKHGKKTLEGSYESKPEAVLAATRLAKRARGILKIKTKTGRIQATRDFCE